MSTLPRGEGLLPRRHGPPVRQQRPQVLTLPQEIIDIIWDYMEVPNGYGYYGFFYHANKLRAVSRTFDTGLFAAYALAIANRTLRLRLTDSGIRNLTLATSRLGPCVRRLKQFKQYADSPVQEGRFHMLQKRNIQMPYLEQIHIDDIGAFRSTNTSWLQSHADNLVKFHVRSSLTNKDISKHDLEPWKALLSALKRAPKLTYTELTHEKAFAVGHGSGGKWTEKLEHDSNDEDKMNRFFENLRSCTWGKKGAPETLLITAGTLEPPQAV